MHSEAVSNLREIEYDLREISKAAFTMGNTDLGHRLLCLANELTESAENARDAFSGQLNERFKESMRSSDNMLRAVLVTGALAAGDTETAEIFAGKIAESGED